MCKVILTPAAILFSLFQLTNSGVAAERPPGADKSGSAPSNAVALEITPASFTLCGSDSVQRLLVTSKANGPTDERSLDFSRNATYTVSDTKVARVSSDGVVHPLGNGSAEISATWNGHTARSKLTVRDAEIDRQVSFRNQIVPMFTKLGCNAGGCHGKASGQNGFKLSLLGFEPDFDYGALVEEARGRRIFPSAPERSLLVQKSLGEVPHGGGRRMRVGSTEYNLLLRWIRQGTPRGSDNDLRVTRIECSPKTCVVGRRSEHQVLVTAYYSDGTQRDVTSEAHFKSNEIGIASVDGGGIVRTDVNTGETAIMARYMGHVDVCHLTIPLIDTAQTVVWPPVPVQNYIDELVQAKWRKLKLVPSPLADDTTFLRRAYLDCIGTLPTPAEVRSFLDDRDPKKREKTVDQLLARNEYADFWALKWGDILRNQRQGQRENQRGTYAFHAWIRNAFGTNMPYDRFVRAIVAAQGTVDQHPPVIWYRTVRNLTHQTNDTAQLFLGMRINCANAIIIRMRNGAKTITISFRLFLADWAARVVKPPRSRRSSFGPMGRFAIRPPAKSCSRMGWMGLACRSTRMRTHANGWWIGW